MSAVPKRVEKALLAFFQDRGGRRKVHPLIIATYYERFEQARTILREDPAQIRDRDPFAGLTPLHIAIFREHLPLVLLLARHPNADLSAADNFGRRPIDMCIYTSSSAIFEVLLEVSYPHAIYSLNHPEGENPGGGSVTFLPRDRRRRT